MNFFFLYIGDRNFESIFLDFSSATSYNSVVRRKDGTVPFKCSACPYQTNSSSHFKDHLRIHSGSRPYCCNLCGKSFTQKQNLKKHITRHQARSFAKLL